MSGSTSPAFDFDALRSVLQDMQFGHVWIFRLVLMIVLSVLCAVSRAEGRRATPIAVLAALLLASLAGVGHTQQNDAWVGWLIHTGADGLHLLAAGAWLGGLLLLGIVITPNIVIAPNDELRASGDLDSTNALLRFSGMGSLAVAVLVISGTINSWYLVGSFANLIDTTYGKLLLSKLVVFGCMLTLAASNRFRLVPRLQRGIQSDRESALKQLRRNVLGEQLLGLVVVLIVSLIGTIEPAVDHY